MIGAYPQMMYNMGLIDDAERVVVQSYCDRAVAHIRSGEMLQAFEVWDQFLNGDVWPYGNYFHNVRSAHHTLQLVPTTCRRVPPLCTDEWPTNAHPLVCDPRAWHR